MHSEAPVSNTEIHREQTQFKYFSSPKNGFLIQREKWLIAFTGKTLLLFRLIKSMMFGMKETVNVIGKKSITLLNSMRLAKVLLVPFPLTSAVSSESNTNVAKYMVLQSLVSLHALRTKIWGQY
jgi:hypothetical protein